MVARRILLTGFAPFGGETVNPSWEVAQALDGRTFGEVTVYAKRLPVDCKRAAVAIAQEIDRARPLAVLGLGQAGGRPALSLEQVAINLVDPRRAHENTGGLDGKPVIADGPAAYFSRLPLKPIIQDGYIQVPDTPGIGVELNEEVCKAHLRMPGYFEPTPQFDRFIVDEFKTGGPYPHIDENGKLVNTR